MMLEQCASTELTQEYKERAISIQVTLTRATRLGDVKSKLMLKEWYTRMARLGGKHRAMAAALTLKLLAKDAQGGHVDVLTVGLAHRLGVLSIHEFAQALSILLSLTHVDPAMAFVGHALHGRADWNCNGRGGRLATASLRSPARLS